jgi:hypothetical protein
MGKLKNTDTQRVTGRCYCGVTSFTASKQPLIVTYCHCADCRRVTGAPVAAFAAFQEADLQFTPGEGSAVEVTSGVKRTFCASCGSPLTGRYDYLPGQVYVPIGLLDQAHEFPPSVHAHEHNRLKWLHIDDDLERAAASSREMLNAART